MSASLVGSEMCIRDSGTERAPGKHARVHAPEDILVVYGQAHRATAGEPVSYTHLTLPTICSV
eukprot:12917247-Alexandrium_andersonii.AAC.1